MKKKVTEEQIAVAWKRTDYNELRPHSFLDNRTPND